MIWGALWASQKLAFCSVFPRGGRLGKHGFFVEFWMSYDGGRTVVIGPWNHILYSKSVLFQDGANGKKQETCDFPTPKGGPKSWFLDMRTTFYTIQNSLKFRMRKNGH